MVSVQIGTTSSAANVLDKNFSLNNAVSAEVKQPCSIEAPIFILKTNENYFTCNYLYCPDFNRYYYITDISANPGGVLALTCTVDALQSYNSQIKELFVNVGRTETEHSNIIDTSLVTTANDEVVFLNFTGAGNPITPTATGRTYLLITSN